MFDYLSPDSAYAKTLRCCIYNMNIAFYNQVRSFQNRNTVAPYIQNQV